MGGQEAGILPALLNRFLVAAIRIGIYNNVRWLKGKVTVDAPQALTRFRYSHGFAEKIVWRDPLRGALVPTDKEAADELAIGGLRDTAASVARLTQTAEFGGKLGADLIQALVDQHASCPASSWIDATCSTIGAAKDTMPMPLRRRLQLSRTLS